MLEFIKKLDNNIKKKRVHLLMIEKDLEFWS